MSETKPPPKGGGFFMYSTRMSTIKFTGIPPGWHLSMSKYSISCLSTGTWKKFFQNTIICTAKLY